MKPSRRARIRYLIPLIALLIGAIYLAAFLWGTGGRGYFSPETLECRTQREVLIPWVGLPIYRGPFAYHRYELVDYLLGKHYWSVIETSEPRWQVTFHSNQQWRDGQSTFHREFGWRSQEWIAWSEKHPELAGVVWPRALMALRDPEQVDGGLIDQIIFAARYATTVDEFESLMKRMNQPVRP